MMISTDIEKHLTPIHYTHSQQSRNRRALPQLDEGHL